MKLPFEVELLACLGEEGVRFFRATILESHEGQLIVRDTASGDRLACDWMDTGGACPRAGDCALVCRLPSEASGIVLGIVRASPMRRTLLALEASESLTLACGESSLTLHADGRVLLKGDDVVLRAKGTQRIRAGHVAIN